MRVISVPTNGVNQIWPQIESLIERGLETSEGDYNKEHAKVFLTNGSWHLCIAVDDSNEIRGAAAVEYVNRPNDRVAFVILAAGRFIVVPEVYAQFCEILRANGATSLEAACHASQARLYKKVCNAREKYRIVEARL